MYIYFLKNHNYYIYNEHEHKQWPYHELCKSAHAVCITSSSKNILALTSVLWGEVELQIK